MDKINQQILLTLFTIAKNTPGIGTEVALEDLHSDPTYQRAIQPKIVARHVKAGRDVMLAAWCGVVARREDGTLWLINGQHHAAAALQLDLEYLKFLILPSVGVEYEAQVYELFQEWQQGKKVLSDPLKEEI